MQPKTTRYSTVSHVDTYKDDSSSTEVDEVDEVDETLAGEEKQWHRIDLDAEHKTRAHAWRRLKGALRRHRWLVDTLLLLTNIGLSLGLSLLLYFQVEDLRFPSSTVEVGGDYTGAGPRFPVKIQKFDANYAFVPPNATEFLSSTTLSHWRTIMPAGAGWKPEEDDGPFFTTTMTHQLHCIYMMGRFYSALASGNTAALPADYHTHFYHCVDYLRQAVMCSADLALEPHLATDADDNGPGDGSWNGMHVCKDYGKVSEYLSRQITEGVRVVLPIDD
ncbi:hypothetical protein CTA2_5301 [Colletotrichum tanaceti]|uniref:Oxidase ustYa n=1 Tax=Colletotrichum tanaceti TaxID=1306861 RepID=A0A4U6X2J4_9PEZI|nr:hypothetical protein CTA2_5301 [Colletotrichum tanaceti]TKW49214.1 hypothetical protein CTA1_7159 [Colletotrichum tanaceti]